jgi:hypothetical protein
LYRKYGRSIVLSQRLAREGSIDWSQACPVMWPMRTAASRLFASATLRCSQSAAVA